MKQLKIILLFFAITILSFSEPILLKNIRFNGTPPQMVIDVDGTVKPKYLISYDEQNRYLFVEFLNTKASSTLKDRIINGQYVKKVKIRKYSNSTGVFVFFNKNIKYSASYRSNPVRFVLDFGKNTAKKEYTVVIDAGHGGKDPGAIGFNRYYEKDIALKIAKELATKLKGDFNVVMTRSNDSFVSLSGRPNIGNKVKGDFFVSIHLNSNNDARANGVDVFYFSRTESDYAKKVSKYENSFAAISGEKESDIKLISGQLIYNKNKEISAKIAKELVDSYSTRLKMKNRGSHGANFAVLRGFDGPSLLVETGFISNSSDVTKLKQSKYQKIAAEEIAKAIKSYFY